MQQVHAITLLLSFTEKTSATGFSGFTLKPGTTYELYLRAGSATIPNSTWTSSTFTTATISLTLESTNLQGSSGAFFAAPNSPINLSFKAVGNVAKIEIDWFGNGTVIQGDPASSGSVVTLTRSFPFQPNGLLVTWSATAYNAAKTSKSNMVQGSFYVVQRAGDCASVVRDVTIPAGTAMVVGTSFTKTWRIINCGTTTWNNYQIAYIDGEKLSTVLSVPIQNGLAPGQTTDVSVPMKAPSKPARYKGFWRVKNAANTFLARLLNVEIQAYIPAPKPKSSGYGAYNSLIQYDCNCPKNRSVKVGNPIDTATGAQNYTLPLLSVSGLRNIDFVAHYSSLVLSTSPMGNGWGHNHETYLRKLADGSVRVSWRSNREDFYDSRGDGTYAPRTKEIAYDTLVKNADGTYLLTRKDTSRYLFDKGGWLRRDINPQAQQLLYSHNEAGLVTQITEPVSGVYLKFNYASVFHLESVSDPLGRKVEFSYDGDGRMIAYKDALGQQTSYTLNADGQVVSAVSPENIKLFENTFDSEGRIFYQKRTREIPNDLFGIDYSGDVGDPTYSIVAKDHFGKSKAIVYQDGYVIKELVDELGNKTQIQYDANNNPIRVIDAKNRTFERTFDSHGNITSVKDPLGQTVSMTYDGNDNLLSRTDAKGKTTRFTYDNKHNVLTVTDANNKTTRFTYTARGKPATVTTPEGNTTRYSYQGGRLSSITDPENNTTRFSYDAAGRVTGITDVEGFTTTLVLDNLDRVVEIIDALGNSTKKTYDSRGNILTITDPNGNTRSFAYDGNKNLVSSTNAIGGVTQYEYDANDRLVKITDPKKIATTLGYDIKGRVAKVIDALNNSITYQYDKTDQLVRIIDPLAQEILYNYNGIDNLVKVTNALNQSSQFEYDRNSNVVAVTNPLNKKTLSRYDALNRLIESTDALSGKASQVYSDDGNITAMTDPNTNKTVFAYDKRGLLTEETNAAGVSHKYSYNGRGLVESIINGRGQVKTITFDQIGRPIKVVDPVGTIDLTYDANGNVLTVKDANGTITRTYDKLNRTTSYTNAAGDKIRYGYDANSNLTILVYPDGRKVLYRYDVLNRLEKVTDLANRVTRYEYDENSRLVKTTRPNGSVETRKYNKINQLVEQKDVTPKHEDRHSDTHGEKESPTTQYTLIYQVNYEYDAAGNITKQTVIPDEKKLELPTSKTMAYGAANRISQFNGKSFDFDADGNMIKAPFNGVSSDLTFNARNQLVSGLGSSYLYDAEGYRIQQMREKNDDSHSEHEKETQGSSGHTNGNSGDHENNSHAVIRYTVNPEAVLSQVLVAQEGNIKTYYIYGLGLIAQEVNKQNYRSYHFDYRGSTVGLSNPEGVLTNRYSYTPFRAVASHRGNLKSPFLYNGRDGVMSDDSGLYYMRARYYSPELHRFVNQDVLLGGVARSSSLNRYGFVEGNPVTGVDPFGLEILLQSHYVKFGDYIKFGDYHTSLKITPDNQNLYKNDNRFINSGGTLFLTMGAGPSSYIDGSLLSEFNRESDVNQMKAEIIPITHTGITEDELIKTLFELNANYKNTLDYDLWPATENNRHFYKADDGYNSNSYIAGLLKAASIDNVSPTTNTPGFDVPVPCEYFEPIPRKPANPVSNSYIEQRVPYAPKNPSYSTNVLNVLDPLSSFLGTQ